MNFFDWILIFYVIGFCSLYCIIFIQSLPPIFSIPLFENLKPATPHRWPRLSIVIAACNEAGTIQRAIESLLHQNYPEMEIIVVNDRSTDTTGEIIDALAHQYDFVHALHIQHLPKGWIGKVYALHVGTQKAQGEWLLYTDADVHFQQGTLQKAIAFALAEECDHFALMPQSISYSLFSELAIQSFGALLLHRLKPSRITKKKSKSFVGIGAFNLVKKSVLDTTDGFHWLRMEVVDDIGLGLLLSNAGAKSRFALSINDVRLVWYPNLKAMFRGLEKNLFGGFAHYSIWRMISIVLFIWLITCAPLVSFFSSRVPYLWIAGALVYVLLFVSSLIAHYRFKQKFYISMLSQVGMILFSLLLLHSGIMCSVKKGIVWRSTRYTLDDLRMGQRVKL
ncbi:MAG: glycosyltransferase [bacterium]